MSISLINLVIKWMRKILHLPARASTITVSQEPQTTAQELQNEVNVPEDVHPETSNAHDLEEKPVESQPRAEDQFRDARLEPGATEEVDRGVVIISGTSFLENETEPATKRPREVVKTTNSTPFPSKSEPIKDIDLTRTGKPYRKRVPTDAPTTTVTTSKQNKPSSTIKRETATILLGDTRERGRKFARKENETAQTSTSADADLTPQRNEFRRIDSPFLLLDLNEANISLLLPEQRLTAREPETLPQQVTYKVEVNGHSQEVSALVRRNRNGSPFVEEKRITVNRPLERFVVTFPNVLFGKNYCYTHHDKSAYVFTAIGNNCGRMFYLFNPDGESNPVPKRNLWLLLHEAIELKLTPDMIGEIWLWENYQPILVDVGAVENVEMKDKNSGELRSFSTLSTFSVGGSQLVHDDFVKEWPLLTGSTIEIVAPHENKNGWDIWIQNRVTGFKVKENWSGSSPVVLECPQDFPSSHGEFQVDICESGIRIPDDTFFFRRMPPLKLSFPRTLIIPDPKSGHVSTLVNLEFDSESEWELKHAEHVGYHCRLKRNHEFQLPPDKDTLRFSFMESGKPETSVTLQVTVPRLKWKTSFDSGWNAKTRKIERRDLETGKSLSLIVRTNDSYHQYDLVAVLLVNNQKLQESKLTRKGVEYILGLNQFLDTIKFNKDELTLRIEICQETDNYLLGAVDVISFERVRQDQIFSQSLSKDRTFIDRDQKKIKSHKKDTVAPRTPDKLQAFTKTASCSMKHRKGKGFSRRELVLAEINLVVLKRLGITYDKRRKSSHPWNVESLKHYRQSIGDKLGTKHVS